MQPLVLDTNVVLDLFVFRDPATRPLQRALDDGAADWIATAAIRDELQHVAQSEAVLAWAGANGRDAADAIAGFGRHARLLPAGPPAPCACRDADDQKFIDLAVAHSAWLLSRDRDVLGMRRRLHRLGVRAGPTWESVQGSPP